MLIHLRLNIAQSRLAIKKLDIQQLQLGSLSIQPDVD